MRSTFSYVPHEHTLKAFSIEGSQKDLSHPTPDGISEQSSPQVTVLNDSLFSACKSWGVRYKRKSYYFRVVFHRIR